MLKPLSVAFQAAFDLAEDTSLRTDIQECGDQSDRYLVLLKPELFQLPYDIQVAIPSLISSCLGSVATVTRVCAFNGRFARQSRVVERNWLILNTVSRHGLNSLDNVTAAHVSDLAAGSRIFGGFEYLARRSDVTVERLEAAVRSASTVKIGAGLYLTSIHLESAPISVLNGFHPQQYAHFVSNSSKWVAIEVHLAISLSEFRHMVIGTLVPEVCPESSLKRRLHELILKQAGTGLSLARNGVHCSPNFLDAQLGIRAIFGQGWTPRPNLISNLETDSRYWLAKLGLKVWNDIEDEDFPAARSMLLRHGVAC